MSLLLTSKKISTSAYSASSSLLPHLTRTTQHRRGHYICRSLFGTRTIAAFPTTNTSPSNPRSSSMPRKDPRGRLIRSAATVVWSSAIFYSTTTPITTMALSNSSPPVPTKTTGLSKSSSSSSSTSILSTLPFDNSWPRMLLPETTDNYQKSLQMERITEDSDNNDNRTKRPVYNGHYVLVKPTGLKNPKLVLVSNDVAHNALQLSEEQVNSNDFLQFVSGNLVLEESWATPYALSIMGKRYTTNCPYGTGNGYGDGRAISIGEFHGYELQLKGAGKTPFHRGADGRAVLRSSIREFLASESMYYLNVGTTRALSLIVSEDDTVMRPWYSSDVILQIPTMDDPRLAQYSNDQKQQIIQQLRTQKADPNIMIKEPCAITCRVAPSFTRIGHLDLMARRVEATSQQNYKVTNCRYDTSTNEWKELEELIWHACYREYREEAYDPYIETKDIKNAAIALLEHSSQKIATMVSNWIRVGFAQGNFNADNCLVGGNTMDYGPFGFLEEYDPLFAKWTGSGSHFGFLNQPSAGLANYQVLVESVVPVIVASGTNGKINENEPNETIERIMTKAQETFQRSVDETFRQKLGFDIDSDIGDDLWQILQPLMAKSRVDWTLFWRQLTYVARDYADIDTSTMDGQDDYEDVLLTLEGKNKKKGGSDDDGNVDDVSPFYGPLSPELRREWIDWLEQWSIALDQSKLLKGAYDKMRIINPKYVLREWMLVDAYTAAANDEMVNLQELYQLIQHPYEEGSSREIQSYYRRAPEQSLTTGGTAFMS